MAFSPDRMRLTDLPDAPSPWVTMMAGAPGSNKSAVATDVGNLLGVEVISAEKTRRYLTGNEKDQSANMHVWHVMYSQVLRALEEERSTIVDATHSTPEWRERDVRRYRSMGAQAVYAIHVYTELEDALRQNNRRGAPVPEHVIVKMHRELTIRPIRTEEGFDGIVTVYN